MTAPGKVIGLDHVQLAAPAGSEDAAREFYGGLLGLPELEKPEALRARGGAWFACGSHQLHVGVAKDFTPATKAHPALAVAGEDLDRLPTNSRQPAVRCFGMTGSLQHAGSTRPIPGVTGSS